MSAWIDRKYLNLVSGRLDRFKQKGQDLFNFRCPFCGDSKKVSRARGYVFLRSNRYFYRCHNCGVGLTFPDFLKRVDPHHYGDYIFEKFNKKGLRAEKKSEIQSTKVEFKPINFEGEYKHLIRIDLLPDDHLAKKYILDRKIPTNRLKDIYYAEDFKLFMDENFPDHGKELVKKEERIVMFYRTVEGYPTHVAGRALGVSELRYMSIKVSTYERKMFGAELMDNNKTVYITEGQFDSMFLDNGVAAGDSMLYSLGQFMIDKLYVKNIVLVSDNEPRNKQIVDQIKKGIKNGFKVVIWPDSVKQKDINDMVVKGGMSLSKIKEIIDNNTFQGLEAELKLISWRKT